MSKQLTENDKYNLICSKCFMTPYIILLNMEQLIWECSCEKKKISIINFLELTNSPFKNIKCVSCSKKYSNFNFYYCSKCKNFECKLCIKKHKKKHTLILIENVNYKCFNHLNANSQGYCIHCKKNICYYCFSQHKFHNIIDFSKIKINKKEKDQLTKYFEKLKTRYLKNINGIEEHKKFLFKTIEENKNELLKEKRNQRLNLLEKRDIMIENFKNFYNKNQNFFLTLQIIFLSSQNLFEEFNCQKNFNFKKISECHFNSYKVNSYCSVISNVFAFINSLDKNLFSLKPKKSEIFTVKKINLPFSSIKVLEDQILINYYENKVKIFNNQFKEISSFNTIKKVDK